MQALARGQHVLHSTALGRQVHCALFICGARRPARVASSSLSLGGSSSAKSHSLRSSARQRKLFAAVAGRQHAARAMAAAASGGDNVSKFADGSAPEFTLVVMGDLHMQPSDAPLFEEARAQMNALLAPPDGSGALVPGARVVQLGDVGGYKDKPGSRECFQTAQRWLSGFAAPALLVTGNHDLEGDEFETDEDNLAAWQQEFSQHHYWRVPLGPVECIGLSTVRYRSNKDSVHEVHIDDEQLDWFRAQLADIAPSRPVLVFTHAPPIGCGLKVLNNVHVKNRCAWLNHSSNPRVFPELVARHPNVRLWFSGHYHLSHDYSRSIGSLGGCGFVSCNVIGSYNRDGLRQSRVLKGNADGYELYTLDHATGGLRLDARQGWAAALPPEVVPVEHTLDEDVQFDVFEVQYDWGTFDETAPSCPMPATASADAADGGACFNAFVRTGPAAAISVQSGILLEFDLATAAPIGALSLSVGDCEVVPVGADGRALAPEDIADGSEVAAVELCEPGSGATVDRIERNAEGGFFRIYQPNKWRKKKAEEAEAARAAAATATAAA